MHSSQVPSDNPLSFWNRLLPHAANLLAWGLLIGLIYLLRSFFLFIFLTFVFAYLQTRLGRRVEGLLPNRIVRVVVVALAFISVLTAAGIFLVPKVKTQTQIFVSQFGLYLNRVDEELERLSEKYPVLEEILPVLAEAAPPAAEPAEAGPAVQGPPQHGQPQRKGLRNSPTAVLLQQLLGLGDLGGSQNLNQIIDTLSNVGGKVLTFTANFLLSLLFSFLIVLDMPVLGRHVRGLADTRLRFIYLAVADNIREFSLVLGRALEAQLIIALVNSALTAIGVMALGLGSNVAFLSVFVFCFSFFPVVGVFISSIPICLVALQSQGLHTMLLAIALITLIHLIEGYVLNPRVYSSYMRINSVIILIILTLAGKLFGFWGLLLGVPVCTYIFGYAIRPNHPLVFPDLDAKGAQNAPPPAGAGDSTSGQGDGPAQPMA